MISPGLDSIDKVPLHFIVGGADTHCSLDHARRIQAEIGPMAKSISIIDGATHGYFEGATGADYVNTVLEQLAADEDSVYNPVFLQ